MPSIIPWIQTEQKQKRPAHNSQQSEGRVFQEASSINERHVTSSIHSQFVFHSSFQHCVASLLDKQSICKYLLASLLQELLGHISSRKFGYSTDWQSKLHFQNAYMYDCSTHVHIYVQFTIHQKKHASENQVILGVWIWIIMCFCFH